LGSYAYNTFGAGVEGTNEHFGLGPVIYWKDAQGNDVPAVSEAQIIVPSEMLAIGDSRMETVGDVMVGGDDVWRYRFNAGASFYPERHGRNYNQLLCDGHVSAMSPWVLFNSSNTASMWNYDHQQAPESCLLPRFEGLVVVRPRLSFARGILLQNLDTFLTN